MVLCFSAIWMRRSTSRTASVYSLTLAWSCGPQLALQRGQLAVDGIENALVLLEAALARGAVGGAGVAEEFLENGARVPFHGQRLRGEH